MFNLCIFNAREISIVFFFIFTKYDFQNNTHQINTKIKIVIQLMMNLGAI